MSKLKGHVLPVSLAQRVVGDFLAVCRSIPVVPFERTMRLADLVAARQMAHPRPSWCAILTKAYAKVVAARQDLRRAYLAFPFERLFEYEETSADVVVEARLGDEDALVSMRLKRPQDWSLLDIDEQIRKHKADPLGSCKRFRTSLTIARLPRFLRRLAWWYALNVSGNVRAQFFATFGVSSVSNWGVDSLRPIAPWTTTLHYGVIDERGHVPVRLTIDHRVLNGSGPARALNEMEQILNTDLLREVQGLQGQCLRAA